MSNRTFHFNGLQIELHPEVYDPAEDTFLLIETIKIEKGDKLLEIGTGCGVIALECARQGADVLCMDTNPYAVELAHANFKRNQHKLTGNFEVRKSDLFSAVKNYEKFNIIIFNPPYLPTSDREKIGGWFDVAVDGGEDGLKIIKRFLQDLKRHLEKNGRAYFVFSSLSNKEKLQKYIENTGLKYEIAATLRFNSETIEIYHLKQTNQDLYQKEPLNVKKQGAAR